MPHLLTEARGLVLDQDESHPIKSIQLELKSNLIKSLFKYVEIQQVIVFLLVNLGVLKPLQDLADDKWGEYDSKGRPTGNGCYYCMATVAEAFPKMTWDEASTTFHDKKQQVWKAAFLGAKEIKRKLVEGEMTEGFKPPSSVGRNQVRSVIVFVEMAFVTESDLARLFNVGSRSLGMGKSVKLQIEDGSFLNGWLLNLRGMPSRELMALRRVRMEMRADVTLTEEILQSIHQLRAEQGQDLWEVACEKQDTVVAQGSVSSRARQKLHTIESLQARVDKVVEDSQLHTIAFAAPRVMA